VMVFFISTVTNFKSYYGRIKDSARLILS